MATFVLVQGAWHGGWCWRRVTERLRAQGHTVFTPTLTGLGDRAHLPTPEVNLDTHIADVLGLIETEELSDIVLCGHSYGGMVVTGAADRIAGKISSLVFLDAFIPENGQSLFDIQGPEREKMSRTLAEEQGHGWLVPSFSAEWFCVADPADAAWVDRRSVPQPIGTYAQPVSVTGAWRTIPRLSYIYALGYTNSLFGPFAEQAKADSGWQYHEVPCGHDVMIDMPDELTALLIEASV
ncbi:MAG: pimeloyl-ACP methyl ester carboxylesterase [Alphaproteobacteria bacterium]|jgi:pimeloyl-ACP methyl ester carboxylesterase